MAKSIRYISRAFQGPFGGPLQIRRHVKALVSFMPRKAPYEAGFIQYVFNRCYPELDGVEWIAIDGQPHSEAMRRLGRTALFLSLAHREGFGLTPIEAMSLRTLVVGFHGGGGLEYATSRNGYWLNEGELIQCVQEPRYSGNDTEGSSRDFR
jgi:glycosyltransferase involved in cell wall biosynthesis